jgi:NADPH-dependent ferric siderophore reductase
VITIIIIEIALTRQAWGDNRSSRFAVEHDVSEFFRKSLYRPSAPRLVRVTRVAPVTPGLIAVTLTGEGLADFPTYCPAAHVKLFLPREGQTRPALPSLGPNGPVWPDGEPKPIVRTYSVRSFRPEASEIDIEFAVHGVEGPATRFARTARPGDYVGLSHPGGPDPMIPAASRYLFAGDTSALPAIASILEHLPAEAGGEALIRVDAATDVRELRRPAGMRVRWFVASPTELEELVAAFRALPWSDDGLHVWLGGEHALVVGLRSYVTQERGIAKEALYALPYWRHRFDEESYHEARDQAMSEASR